MQKRLTLRGRHTILPIVGDTVVEIHVSAHRGPVIILADVDGRESMIELADQFTIGRGIDLRAIEHQHATQLSPLLELVGATVTEALASAEGRLELVFSNAMRLEVASTTGYEAWHYQYPRPGRPPSGDIANAISLHGGAERLL